MSPLTSKIVPDKVNSFHVPKKEEDSTLPRKHGAWSWLIAPDGTFSTVNDTATKAERREPDKKISPHKRRKVEKSFRGAWSWLLAPGESTTVVEPKREDDVAPKVDAMPISASRKRKFQCKWNWLLAPDGTPATVDMITEVANSLEEELTSTGDMVHAKDLSTSKISAKGGSPRRKALDAKHHECPRSYYISDENHERWERNFQLLVDYKKQYKTTRVPTRHQTLGAWTLTQRQLYKRNKLTKYRRERLESINFVQDPRKVEWMVMYDRLLSYKKQHGCTNLPRTIKQDEKLTEWMHVQRRNYRINKLSEDRILLLESIGFEFKLRKREVTTFERDAWMEMYQRLVAYKEKHKNTRVPQLFESDPKLGSWVQEQRSRCTNEERIDLLNYIGFEWTPLDSDWMKMYQRLLAFRKKHKHTRVPYKFVADPELGYWVHKQRQRCSQKGRADLLNAIGFEWNTLDSHWMNMYQRLLAFRKKHKHTRVPRKFVADPELGYWVRTQRQRCSQKGRVDLLNAVGFEWDPTGKRSGLKPFTKP